ncbi:MAG: hypothetical protein PUC99_01470 [Eubacteriales bacterium]|nr:hypothetical protein [Eubacteriales bacterium]
MKERLGKYQELLSCRKEKDRLKCYADLLSYAYRVAGRRLYAGRNRKPKR